MKRLGFLFSLFAVAAMLAGASISPAVAADELPIYSASKLGTGMLRLWTTSISSPEALTYIKVTAVDTCKFSLWRLNAAGTNYAKVAPTRHGGASSAVDSMITLLPGKEFELRVPAPGLVGIYFSQGDGLVRGN